MNHGWPSIKTLTRHWGVPSLELFEQTNLRRYVKSRGGAHLAISRLLFAGVERKMHMKDGITCCRSVTYFGSAPSSSKNRLRNLRKRLQRVGTWMLVPQTHVWSSSSSSMSISSVSPDTPCTKVETHISLLMLQCFHYDCIATHKQFPLNIFEAQGHVACLLLNEPLPDFEA